MPRQKPTMSPREELAYDSSTESIIDHASGSNAPGRTPNPYLTPKEHKDQIEVLKATQAFPGRWYTPAWVYRSPDESDDRYNGGWSQCDVCGEWTRTGECRCYRGA